MPFASRNSAVQIAAYLSTLGQKFPKNPNEMIKRADRFVGIRPMVRAELKPMGNIQSGSRQ